MDIKRTVVLIVTLITIVGVIFWLESMKVGGNGQATADIIKSVGMDIEEKREKYPRAKEVEQEFGFVNTEGITIEELVGNKVVLLDIWTYSCINCQRTFPYLNAWYEKYKDFGLEIVAVHTPEFDFEKKIENVETATKQFGITYPVVLDNAYRTWNAYNNRYWPRKYMIDIDGYVVYDHIGEGGYEETEHIIQNLLEERKERLALDIDIPTGVVDPLNNTEDNVVAQKKPRSPEIYFGAWRNERLGNGGQKTEGEVVFVLPKTLKKSFQYFEGSWNITREYAENTKSNTKIVFPYQATDVFMVASSDEGVRVRVYVDGEIIGKNKRGSDVDDDGYVFVREDRLYRLVEDINGWGEHLLELVPESPGLEIFTFTFG